MNELHDADLNQGNSLPSDVILLCYPPKDKEGDAIAEALRGLGFTVPLGKLAIIEVRMLEESPRLLILDIDQHDAVPTIERMRELPDGAALPLVCIGDKARADELRAGYAKWLPRPVNMADLLAYVTEHAGSTPKARKTQPSIAPPPPGSQRPPDTIPPPTHDSDSPEPIDHDGTADPFDIGSILPSTTGALSGGPALSTELSPELEQLMLSAERRVGAHVRASTLPPPDEDDLILPSDLLLALDEPLDPEAEDEGPGTGPAITTRSLALAKLARRGGQGPSSSGGLRAYDPISDGAQGTPAETDPMQPSRSARSFQLPPSSVGVPSRRGGRVEEDTATEGPVSRDAITPAERRATVSTRTFDAYRSQQGPPSAGPPRQAKPSFRDQETPIPRRAALRQQEAQPPPPPARPSPSMRPQESLDPRTIQHDMSAATHTKQNRPFYPTPPSPLSVVPGSIYSTRSAASRSAKETVRPASTIGAMTEAMRRPPSTAASPAPMPASARSPSRKPPPMPGTTMTGVIPPAPRMPTSPSPALAAPPPPQGRRPSTPPRRPTPLPDPARASSPELAQVLGDGDAALVLAQVIAGRASGSLALTDDSGTRRIVLQDGDIMTAASWAPTETLLAFLAARGDIDRDVAARFESKLPPFGRHAGAALIAHGHLGQDDLWPVLRAHAEWIIGRAVLVRTGTCELEPEPPGRLKAEPNVFGGATGAEVLIETVRRVVPPDAAMRRVGGHGARVNVGPRAPLLSECALRREEEDLVRTAQGRAVSELLEATEPEFVTVIYALACLGVIELYAAPAQPRSEPTAPGIDPLDEEAVRQRVRARLALVEDGDYFSVIGVARTATSYEVRRAYLELRRAFEPARLLTAATADLQRDVRLVIEVLDEAYDILREPHRRERYRKAIESPAPQ